MQSKLIRSRLLALELARVARIQPEPEQDKISRVQADQERLKGKGPVRLRRSGERNLVAKPQGLVVGSVVHRLFAQNYYYRCVMAPRWEQLILLETLFRE